MLLFQQRGTELTIAELDAVTYSATGLRETKRFYRSAISGLIVDPQQQEALLLQTAPQMAFFKFQIRGTEMIPVCNSTLWSTSNDLILNVWNVFPLERHGSLIAVAPSASGFNTTVLVVKPDDGMVSEVFSVAGAPIRGISTIDRGGERYFFAVSRGGERQVVVYYPESGSAEEWSLDWGDIVGLHYDNAQCRLLAFYLRGAGKINVQALRFETGQPDAEEVAILWPAVGEGVTAAEMLGMTALVIGDDGTRVVVWDPRGARLNVFHLEAATWHPIKVDLSGFGDGVIGVAVRPLMQPRVSEIEPREVGMMGHGIVQLIGADFGLRDPSPLVSIGGSTALSSEWVSDTLISVRTPASVLAGRGFNVTLVVGGGADAKMPREVQLEFVEAWHTILPNHGTVAGQQLVTLFGGQFGNGMYTCQFGGEVIPATVLPGDAAVTCRTPRWMQPAGLVSVELLLDGARVHRDGDGKFLYLAGAPERLVVQASPRHALGGEPFGSPFVVSLQDGLGNTVLTFDGEVRVDALRLPRGAGDTGGPLVRGVAITRAHQGTAVIVFAIDRHGMYVLSFFAGDCGNCTSTRACEGCFSTERTFEVGLGRMVTLVVQLPKFVVAGENILPPPIVRVLDSGGNIANVSEAVHVRAINAAPELELIAPFVACVDGVAKFTDLRLSLIGPCRLEFYFVSGIKLSKRVVVLQSRPHFLSNPQGLPTNVQKSMSPVSPAPSIGIMDKQGNRIYNTYWTQDGMGTIQMHFLNLTITASLSTTFDPSAGNVNPALEQPFAIPANLSRPVGSFFGTTHVHLWGDATLAKLAFCPDSCTGHGLCAADGCECDKRWRGKACSVPSYAHVCTGDCESGVGFFAAQVCACLPELVARSTQAQTGSTARFEELLVDAVGQAYVATFSSPGLLSARSLVFSILAGIANHLYVVAQPGSGVGGEELANVPLVETRDAGQNLVERSADGGNASVSVALVDVWLGVRTEACVANGTTMGAECDVLLSSSRATLSGVLERVAAAGHAAFPSLSVDIATSALSTTDFRLMYKLAFFSSGLQGAFSALFEVAVGHPHRLVLVRDPGDAKGGTPFRTQPVLGLKDRGGNWVHNSSAAAGLGVTAMLLTGVGPLSGDVTLPFENGLAEYENLALNFAQNNVQLLFVAPLLAMSEVFSFPFAVRVGDVAELHIARQPRTAVGGILQVQPQLDLRDAGGNVVWDQPMSVLVNARHPIFPTVSFGVFDIVNGTMEFTDLRVFTVGDNYTLHFASPPLADVESDVFENEVGPPHRLEITVQPRNSTAAERFAPAPQVRLLDLGGNLVPSDGVVVSAALNCSRIVPLFDVLVTDLPSEAYMGAECVSGLYPAKFQLEELEVDLSFARDPLLYEVRTSGGLATFDLAVGTAGEFYVLDFASVGLLGAQSVPFTVHFGSVAVALDVLCQPHVASAAAIFWRQPVIQFVDAGWNRVHAQAQTVTASLWAAPDNATLTGAVSVPHGDLATFTNLAIDAAGDGYVLAFKTSGLKTARSAPFRIQVSVPVALHLRAPLGHVQGGEAFTVEVISVDAGGNTQPNATGSVSVRLLRVVEQVRELRCRGMQRCTAQLNTSIPEGAVLLSARLTASVTCTDLDFEGEAVKHVRLADYALAPGTEFVGGPWQDCFRKCFERRALIAGYPAVQDVCWDARGNVCTRLIRTSAWNPTVETRYEYMQRLSKFNVSDLPLYMHLSDEVNLHRCDGYFLNADVALALRYAVPEAPYVLSGADETALGAGGAIFEGLKVSKIDRAYVLEFSAAGLASTISSEFEPNAGPPRYLRVHRQPGNGTGNTTLMPQPSVELLDFGGNRAQLPPGAPPLLVHVEARLQGTTSCLDGRDRPFQSFGTLFATDALAAEWVGELHVQSAGLYVFAMSTHGESHLRINGSVVVAAQHVEDGPRTARSAVELGAGSHALKVDFLRPAAVACGELSVRYTGPDTNGAEVEVTGTHVPASGEALHAGFAVRFVVAPELNDARGASDYFAYAEDELHLIANLRTTTDEIRYGAVSLRGRTSTAPTDGLATFTDLFIGARSADGTRYRLEFAAFPPGAAAALTVWSADVLVKLGPACCLEIGTQPGDGYGGEALVPQPVVFVSDWSSNVVPIEGPAVTVTVGVNGGLVGTLLGSASVVPSGGVARFTDVAIDVAGRKYTLIFSAQGLHPSVSDPFDVAKGAAARLVVTRQPSGGVVLRTLAVQPAVATQDLGGNVITDWAGEVIASIGVCGSSFHPAMSPNGKAQLLGTFVGHQYEGVAYFWNLRLDQMGADFTLRFVSDPKLAPATSRPFNIYGGPASELRVLVLPSTVIAVLAIPDIVVAAVDGNGNADGAFAVPLRTVLRARPGSAAELAAPAHFEFKHGVAVLRGMQLSGAESLLRLYLSAGTLALTTEPFDAIDPLTGWWDLRIYSLDLLLSLRRSAMDVVSAMWRMPTSSASVMMSFVSQYTSVLDQDAGCISTAGVIRKDGEGSGGMFVQSCEAGSLRGETAFLVDAGPDDAPAMYATDVEPLVVHEHFPAEVKRHFVLVANRFSRSTPVTVSSLYEWLGGRLIRYQGLPGTKGAHAWTHYKMGGVHYLIVANHFDDSGNGYGVPSVIYRYMWSASVNKSLFEPIQAISSAGAVAWEHFSIDGEDFLAVANYFNGSHFAISSKVYQLRSTNPDSHVPLLTYHQSISTNGARDVKHFTSPGGRHHLAYANRWGGTVSVHTWDPALQRFAPALSLPSRSCMSLAPLLTRDGTTLLVVVNAGARGGSLSDISGVFRLDLNACSFNRLQTLPTTGASYARLAVLGGDALLAVANVHDPAAGSGSSDVYRWDATRGRFETFLVLPTRNAYAVAIVDIPCLSADVVGGSCGTRERERVVLSVDGWSGGSGIEVFQLRPFNASAVATHLRAVGAGPRGSAVHNASAPLLAPATIVQLMRFDAPVAREWDLPVHAGAFVWGDSLGHGAPVSRAVALHGATSLALNVSGMATFDELVSTQAGELSVRLYNDYLNNVTMALTPRFSVAAGHANTLRVEFSPRVLPAGEPFRALVIVNDDFGNFQPLHNALTVTAAPAPGTLFALNNGTVAALRGRAEFSLEISGNGRGHRVAFSAPGMAPDVSDNFTIESSVWVYPLPDEPQLLPGVPPVAVGSGVLYFGGLSATGPSSALVRADYAWQPPRFDVVSTSGVGPAARYDHAALAVAVGGHEVMVVHGGTDGIQNFSGAHVLDIANAAWLPNEIAGGCARTRHGALHAVTSRQDIAQPWLTTVFSLVVLFGGKGDDGLPLADMQLLRVYRASIGAIAAPVQRGLVPPPCVDPSMAWHSGKGYLFGGRGLSGTLYTFTLLFDGEHFAAYWVMLPAASGAADGPSRVQHLLLDMPLIYHGKFLFLARTPPGATNETEIVALDVSGDSTFWEGTSLRAGAAPDAEFVRTCQISEGKFVLVAPNYGAGKSSAWVVSLVSSVSLVLSPFLPSSAKAGEPFRPHPLVTILDGAGLPVRDASTGAVLTVHAYDDGGNPLTLGGTIARAAKAGVAAFTDLSVDKDAAHVRLVFTANALTPTGYSRFFTVGAGPAARIVFLQAPVGVYLSQPFVVQPSAAIQDTAGNLVVSDSFSTLSATLAFAAASGGLFHDRSDLLIGTTTIRVSSGIAEFKDLGIADGATAGVFRLEVSRAGTISAHTAEFRATTAAETLPSIVTWSVRSRPCSIGLHRNVSSTGCAALLRLAGDAAVSGLLFSWQPKLKIEVAGTDLTFQHGPGLKFAAKLIDATTNASVRGGILGSATAEAVNGSVVWTDFAVQAVGAAFRIEFSAPDFPTVYSPTFAIRAGPPAAVRIDRGAADATAGQTFKQQPRVTVLDAGGNPVELPAFVTAVSTKGAAEHPIEGTPALTVAGVANFTDLYINEVGTGYRLVFSVTDECCNDTTRAEGGELAVLLGQSARMAEAITPSGARGGVEFATQPVVQLLDAGGNAVTDDSETVVSVTIEKDDTIHMTTAIASLAASGVTVADIESFSANGTTYIVAALRYDGTTYAIASKLYRWTGSAIEEMQDIPSDGAEDWEVTEVAGQTYVFLANNFREVSNADGLLLGTYVTASCIYAFNATGSALSLVESFTTEGARSIEVFRVGAKTYVAVANSYNDTHSRIASTLYRFDPDESVGRSVLTRLQEIPTVSASIWHFFMHKGAGWVMLAQEYNELTHEYAVKSVLYRFTGGQLLEWQHVSTSFVKSVESFHVGARTFVLVLNRGDSTGHTSSGLLVVFEMVDAGLVERQRIEGLSGAVDMAYFHLNSAEWVAVARNVTVADATGHVPSSQLDLYSWSTHNCSSVKAVCILEFALFTSLPIDACESVHHFRDAAGRDLLLYGGHKRLGVVGFESLAELSGTTTATAVNGIVTFQGLSINIAQPSYRLLYSGGALEPTSGRPFVVQIGSAERLVLERPASKDLRVSRGGAAFDVQPTVAVVDRGGNVLSLVSPGPTPSVIAAIDSAAPAETALVGRAVVLVYRGRAVFTDLGVDRAGEATLSFTFSEEGIAPVFVNFSIAVGAPHALALRAGADVAWGGIAFALQPVVAIVDRGGNLATEDPGPRVAAMLVDPEASFESVEGEADFAASGVGAARFARVGGESFILRADGTDVEVRTWSCNTPGSPVRLGVVGAHAVESFRFAGADWLAVAINASMLNVLRYNGTTGSPSGSPSFLDRDVSVKAPGLTSVVSVLIGGRQFLAASIGNSADGDEAGTALYELVLDSDGSTVLQFSQNVSTGARIESLAHLHHAYEHYLFELLPDADELRMYRWDHKVDSFELFDYIDQISDVVPYALVSFATPVGPMLGIAGKESLLLQLAEPGDPSSISMMANNATWLDSLVTFEASAIATLSRGDKHLLAFAGEGEVAVVLGNGVSYVAVAIDDATAGSAAPFVEFVLHGGYDYLLAEEQVLVLSGAAKLSGSTVASTSDGLAHFSDLSIDREGTYRLAFMSMSLDEAHPTAVAWLAARTFTSTDVQVGASGASALVQVSSNLVGTAPAVKLVDAGGNDAVVGDPWLVTAVLDDPDQFSLLKGVQDLTTLSARDVEEFTIGSSHLVAVANNFDGGTYRVDSQVFYLGGSAPPELTHIQALATRGAYAVSAFAIDFQGEVTATDVPKKSTEHFLAFANHYDDADGYLTQSELFRWNPSIEAFVSFQRITTAGATDIAPFVMHGIMHLAVSNFFDGNLHTVDSVVWRYNLTAGQFARLQRIPTHGAHHVAHVVHRGRHFLAFAQFRDANEVGLATFSPVYAWSDAASAFMLVASLPSSAAMHIEPFTAYGAAFLAVANHRNSSSGSLAATPAVFELSCTSGVDLLLVHQKFELEGLTKWRHFRRGGDDYLAGTLWAPAGDQAANTIVVYRAENVAGMFSAGYVPGETQPTELGRFLLYTSLPSRGTVAVDFAFVEGGYVLVQAVLGDGTSLLQHFVNSMEDTPPRYFNQTTSSGRAIFSAIAADRLSGVGVGFDALPLDGALAGSTVPRGCPTNSQYEVAEWTCVCFSGYHLAGGQCVPD